MEFKIELTKLDPFRQNYRTRDPIQQEIEKQHIEKMLNRRVIRSSKFPNASPIMLVAKANGKVRFCVDYRELNDRTKKWSYPLPKINDVLKYLSRSLYYSTLDMTEAFWSIPIKEKDKEKTAFISQYGLWNWNSMPFGLFNALATQQHFMDKILSGLQWQICINYIDDIVVFSKTFDEHLQSLEKVLERLRENKLRINLDKVKLCQPKFALLGFTAMKKGILYNDKKVRAIIDYPEPANHKELQSFLGLVSWC